jgi:hypothetical protein
LEGDYKIGGKVKFVYFFEEFIIIPDFIYQQRLSISESRKFNRKEKDIKKCLFEDILYVKHKDGFYKFTGRPDQKK